MTITRREPAVSCHDSVLRHPGVDRSSGFGGADRKTPPDAVIASGGVPDLAPREGFEPPTKRLTAACSTAELPGNGRECFALKLSPEPVSRSEKTAIRCRRFVRAHLGSRQAGKDGTRNPSCRLNGGIWRPRPESNRRTRICSPLHNHSATRPLPEPPRLICRKRRLEREALVIDKGRTPVKNRVMVFYSVLSSCTHAGDCLVRGGRL